VSVAAESVLHQTVARVRPAHARVPLAVQEAFDAKAKPPGSLGRLEELAGRVAAIRGTATPDLPTPAVVVCAADHGVAVEDVSAYPQEVTAAMVATFASGGAAVSVLARQAGARLVVADLGVKVPVAHPAVLDRRIGPGTGNAAKGPAMSVSQAERALSVGIELAAGLVDDGVDLIAIGDMGIANTTSASALAAGLLGVAPAAVCGRGTGLDDVGLVRKIEVVVRMLAANPVPAAEPVRLLAGVGGFEIGALAGLILGAAAHHVPVVLDGFITGAAALLAARIAPAGVDAMIAAHRSSEPGHRLVLNALGLEPLFDLDLRLGEASGAALALPLIASSVALLREMATLAEVTGG
jgi:nicotinate-nucleotide--dimethylbenzimidazole phosphoribosyltransferase